MLFIVIIFLFISLGLPDGAIGSAWPAIYPSIGANVGDAGILSLVVTSMTIISSLMTELLVKKLGMGRLMVLSTFLTAFALIGYSQTTNLLGLFVLAVPLGLGAGAIDSAINNYVAINYKAHHMNWLHASWGVGATLGPIMFSSALIITGNWHIGFLGLGIIQMCVVFLLLFNLSLWLKSKKEISVDKKRIRINYTFRNLLHIGIARASFICFFIYTGIEVGAGLWLATYLVNIQDFSLNDAAFSAGLYYGAITVGRVLIGFALSKIGNKAAIRLGMLLAAIGVALISLNISPIASVAGVVCVGLGFAPIYPGMIHATPSRFGRAKSPKMMSLQMVGGYLGATIIPPLIGVLSYNFSITSFIYTLIISLVLLFAVNEYINKNL